MRRFLNLSFLLGVLFALFLLPMIQTAWRRVAA